MLYHIATRYKGSQENSKLLIKYICSNKITSELQLNGMITGIIIWSHFLIPAALDYLKRYPIEVDVAMFESNCGVGIVVTAEDIKNEVSILQDTLVY